MKRPEAAFAIPLVLVMIVVCSVVGVSAVSLFSARGKKIESTFARRQAVIAAESGFNWAVSKLLQNTIGKRWYAFNDGDDCTTISDDNSGSTMEVFLCDVFNDRGELAHVHVLSRGSYSIPSSWKSETAICFGTVQITGDQDNLSAVILEKRILDTYRFPDLIDSNEALFSAAENKFASGERIFFDNSTYEEGKNKFLQSVRKHAVEDLDISEHSQMRPVVALLERYIELLNEIRLARIANSLLRNSNLEDIFNLASETSLSLADLLSTLNAIQKQGDEFTSDSATTLGAKLTRSQRELLITYLLLKRIKELPSTTLITVKGNEYPPEAGAVRIGGLFYEKVAQASPGNDGIESLFDKMLRLGKRLNEINVMRTFFSIIDPSAPVVHQFVPLNTISSLNNGTSSTEESGEGSGEDSTEEALPEGWSDGPSSSQRVVNSAVPVRDSLIEVARSYGFNSSRIPYGSYEGLVAMDGDVSPVEFERSLSTLDVYDGGSDNQKRSEERIKNYLNDAAVEDGAEGFQNVTIQAGSLGLDGGNKGSFVNILQDSAVSNNVQNLTVYLPSADTQSTPEDVGTMVEDIEVAITSIFTDNDVVDNPLAELGPGSVLAFGGTNPGGTNPGGANPNSNLFVGPSGSNNDLNTGSLDLSNPGPGSITSVSNADLPDSNGSGGVQVTGTDGSQGGSVFIPTNDVAGTTEILNNLLESYQASNPDSDVIVGINAVNNTGGSSTPPAATAQLSDTLVQDVGAAVPDMGSNGGSIVLENDYTIANDTPGDDAWITVGKDLGVPLVTSEPPGSVGNIPAGN